MEIIYRGEGFQKRIDDILNEVGAKKPFLVCDESFSVLKVQPKLASETVFFKDYSPNPKLSEVKKGLALFKESGCDVIISLGGGSSIDVAKCINILEISGNSYDLLEKPRVKHIAIPTTAGTGSEATTFAVVYINGEKNSVDHVLNRPDYTVLNPDFLLTLPDYQKKSTLLDALCQGIESFWSVKSTEESMEYSRQAIKLILENRKEYIENTSAKSCEAMMRGANLAGKAINITQTTAAHAMSYKLSGIFKIAHGHSAALCLPVVWSYMLKNPAQICDVRGKIHLLSVFSELDKLFGGEALKGFIDIVTEFGFKPLTNYKSGDMEALVGSVNEQRLKNNPIFIPEEHFYTLYSNVLNPTKKGSPKISIIVPVYNVEKYLSLNLYCLVNQTLNNIEIIIVNDGSPDNSQEIIDDYQKRYPHLIKSFIKENGGLSDARNFGIKKATGEFLAFVDSDDFFDFDMFEQMYNQASQTGADVVVSPLAYYNLDTRTVSRRSYNENFFGKSAIESPFALLSSNSPACNKIYNRYFWNRNKFEFPVGQLFEDSAVIYNVLLSANKIEMVNTAFYKYVKGREGAITKLAEKKLFDIFKSMESLNNYYKKKNSFYSLKDTLITLNARHIFSRIPALRPAKGFFMKNKFVKKAFKYMNQNFPAWRISPGIRPTNSTSFPKRLSLFVQRHYLLAWFYIHAPNWIVKTVQHFEAIISKLMLGDTKAKKTLRANIDKENKRRSIQTSGLELIELVQTTLKEYDIDCFADFGTLLGIIRDKRLLKHDTDIDLGVILKDQFDIHKINYALERVGFKLWRRYYLGDRPCEDSYFFEKLKIDIGYYKMDNKMRTHLFYRKSERKKYPNNTRDVVQMSYSPISGVKQVEVKGCKIFVPIENEKLLEEKYGPNWRTPDTGWVYWNSPAAKKIKEKGYYFLYRG